MGYSGSVLNIPCNEGGFVYALETQNIPIGSFIFGSKNIDLNQNGRIKRGGTRKVNTSTVSGAPRIMGMFDFVGPSQSFQVFSTSDGNIYKDTSTTIKTGLATSVYPSFSVFGQELYFCNGSNTPQTWDGAAASTSDITTPAADWTGATQPFQLIAHGRGASRRLWALMGNAVYYSVLGNGKDFAGTGSGKITIDTGDTFGLTGGVEFGNRLIVFSKRKAFVIDDSDVDTANWGYDPAQWDGGAAHWRVITKTKNDVYIMSDDGDIYSFSAVQSYGDYKAASIASPAFINLYMKERADLSKIDQFHAIYDESMRALRFFVAGESGAAVDTCLLYFIDKSPGTGWSIHGGESHVSGYDASCSALVNESAGKYTVYTGDYSGFLWKLNQDTYSDDGTAYEMVLKLPRNNIGDIRSNKEFKRYSFSVSSISDDSFSVVSENEIGDSTEDSVEFSSGGISLPFTLTASLGSTSPADVSSDVGIKGRTINTTITHSTLNKRFSLYTATLDHKALGAKPQ